MKRKHLLLLLIAIILISVKAGAQITNWDQLYNAVQNGGNISLTQDIIHSGSKTCLAVPEGKTVTLDLNGYTIDRNLTEAKSQGDVFEVSSGATLKIIDSSKDSDHPFGKGIIKGAYNSSNGGVIVNNGTLVVEGGSFIGNKCGINGGVVYNEAGSSMTVAGAAFKDNWTRFHGGAIFVRPGASLYVNAVDGDNTKTLFSGNTAIDPDADKGGCGGAICNEGTTFITGGEFTNNFGQFGSILTRGRMTVSGGYFHGERFHDGKGTSPIVCNDFTYFKLEGNPVFEDNQAVYGAIQFQCWSDDSPSECYVEGGTFKNNFAIGGAALTVRCAKAEDINLKVSGGLFENNTAYYGGVFDISGGTITVTGGTYRNNKAIGGEGNNAEGGVFAIGKGRSDWSYEGTLTISGGVYEGNEAEFGALAYNHGTMNLSGSPAIGSNQDVYLSAGADAAQKSQYVITKVGSFSSEVPVTIQNEVAGRDILVSKAGASSSSQGQVTSADLELINVALESDIFRVLYNAQGRDSDVTPKDVIELFGKSGIIIKRKNLPEGVSSIYNVYKDGSSTPLFVVSLHGDAEKGTQSCNIVDLQPGAYEVREMTWNWTQDRKSTTVEPAEKKVESGSGYGKGIISDESPLVFIFDGESKENMQKHGENYKENKFVVSTE